MKLFHTFINSNERLVSRMNNILYAMIESFKNMQEEIHRVLNLSSFTEEENNKLFLSVGTCLHSILDYADRVKIEKKDEKLVSAFRYANNSLKHCIEVKDITKQNGGFTFPIEFPLVIAKKEVVWSIIDNGGEDKKNQRNNYKKLLEEKEIIETCKNVIEILEKYEL